MKNIFEGTGVAIITPFTEEGSIDFGSLEKTLNHVINGGVDYIVAMGTTAETATLSSEEKSSLIDFFKKSLNGKLPLVLGAGGNNTAEVVKTIKSIDKEGVAAILSVAPYYNKPGQEGIKLHFKAIAESTDLPIIIYNVPGRTSSNISASTAISLANEHSNIIAVKEASGNFTQIMDIIKNKPEGFEVLSGDDALTLPMICLGAKGVISVVANSHPKEFSSLVKAALAKDFDTANKYQYQLIDYINGLFEEGSPSGLKAALSHIGLAKNYVRLPLVPVSDKHSAKMKQLLQNI